MRSPNMLRCCECDKRADWVRCTQFAGDHPFCDEHAKQQPSWGKDDPSYWYWVSVSTYEKVK